MKFVNYGINNELFPYMPRRTLIDEEEIDDLWIPSIKNNVTYHVVDDKRIIASATVLRDVHSNKYEHANKRPTNSLGIVISPEYQDEQSIRSLIIRTLFSERIPFTTLIPVEDKSTIKTYRQFSMLEEEVFREEYKSISLSGNCIRCTKE